MTELNLSKISASTMNLFMSYLVKEHQVLYSFDSKTSVLKINAEPTEVKGILSKYTELLKTISTFTV